MLVNADGTVVNANTIALQTFEMPGAPLVGCGLLDLLPQFDPRLIPGAMHRPDHRESPGRTSPARMTARRTDGSAFPVEVTSAYLANEQQTHDGYGLTDGALLILVVRDLSGTVDTEAELAWSLRRTEMILRAVSDGVVGTDTDGRIVLVNPAAARLLGHRAGDLAGRQLHEVMLHSRADGSPFPYSDSPLADTLHSGRKHRVRGQVLWSMSGEKVSVDLTTSPVRDGDQLFGAVMTFTDRRAFDAFAEKKDTAEKRCRQLETLLNESLRAPLLQLHRELAALAADEAGQLWPEAHHMLRSLAAVSSRIKTAVDDVLGHQPRDPHPEPLDPNPDLDDPARSESGSQPPSSITQSNGPLLRPRDRAPQNLSQPRPPLQHATPQPVPKQSSPAPLTVRTLGERASPPNATVSSTNRRERRPEPDTTSATDSDSLLERASDQRRLLAWPVPQASMQQTLSERGYRTQAVFSREELNAQIASQPAALFVDPLTGPITRTALQSLRQAAVAADIPVMVTAGLGHAPREAASGADPAVLLKALAPRDREVHPPRVLLVEEQAEIAFALTALLERRGMQVVRAASDADAIMLARQMQPNLVVVNLMQVHHKRAGAVDWLRANGQPNRTPLVAYTAGVDRADLPRLASGETVLFLAERSTSADVQTRIVNLLSRISR
ncbi:PAS domain-containing protein [Streptomyces torulosus]|uniref:PAS domain-containing protein n=1 Tax=Streptomyces torulosus TaxID=68276 RepID=UPI0006EB54E0|nr:PAS domain-containing protein [Streptomyces torulosus]